MKRLLFATLLVVGLSAQTTRTTPQSVNPVTLLNAVTTTGFSLPPTNIGQNIHILSYTISGSVNNVELQIDGSYDCTTTNAVRISDIATNVDSGTIYASGWYPCIYAHLVTFNASVGTPTLTAKYIATSQTFTPSSGPYNTSGVQHKRIAVNADASLTTPYIFDLPMTASAVVVFQFGGAFHCANSTLLFQAGYNSVNANYSVGTVTLADAFGTQAFVLPVYVGIRGGIVYTPGGGCINTELYSIDIFFSGSSLQAPGGTGPSPIPPPAFADYLFNYATGQWEPRLVPTKWKPQTNVAVAAATDTTLWTPAAGTRFRVMGFHLTGSVNSPCSFRDNTTGTVFYRFDLAGIPGVPEPIIVNGYLSTAVNNVLVINCTNALTLNGTVWGVEQ